MLRDLLNPTNTRMKIRDSASGVYIEGVTEMYVRDAQEVIDLMTMGAGNRTVAGTNMNAVSSRSHGVFMLKLISTNTQTGSKKISKLMMVDLAGSEKVAKTGASGQTLEEAKKINQSLSALGNVMNSLSSGKGHVAYRDSVLTRLLSDSLGGNCKTTLLIACSSSSYNAEETITTCRFGTRAKKIKNKAKINAEKTVEEYKKELAAANAKIADLKRLCRAYKMDLAKAKKGLLKEGDQGIADRLLAGEKVAELDDKKKKKKAKQAEADALAAALARNAADLAAKEKKESKDNEDDNDDDDDDNEVKTDGSSNDDNKTDGSNNDDNNMTSVSNETIEKYENEIETYRNKCDEYEDSMTKLKEKLQIQSQALLSQEAQIEQLEQENKELATQPSGLPGLHRRTSSRSYHQRTHSSSGTQRTPRDHSSPNTPNSKKRKSVLPPPAQPDGTPFLVEDPNIIDENNEIDSKDDEKTSISKTITNEKTVFKVK